MRAQWHQHQGASQPRERIRQHRFSPAPNLHLSIGSRFTHRTLSPATSHHCSGMIGGCFYGPRFNGNSFSWLSCGALSYFLLFLCDAHLVKAFLLCLTIDLASSSERLTFYLTTPWSERKNRICSEGLSDVHLSYLWMVEGREGGNFNRCEHCKT